MNSLEPHTVAPVVAAGGGGGAQSLQREANEWKKKIENVKKSAVITVLRYRDVMQDKSCGGTTISLNTALPMEYTSPVDAY